MIDPENRALVVENVQNLEPEVVQSILGKLATHGADYHILPRTDIRIHFEKEEVEDELAKLLRSLPSDVRYGYFRYQEFFDFTKAYIEGQNISEGSIQKRVSLLWNKFANGGGVYAGHWEAPGARVDIIVDQPNELTHWGGRITQKCCGSPLTKYVCTVPGSSRRGRQGICRVRKQAKKRRSAIWGRTWNHGGFCPFCT
jgi:hypothetical protein